MERALESVPEGLSSQLINVAFASSLPSEYLSDTSVPTRIGILRSWLNDTQLGQLVGFDSMSAEPRNVRVNCRWAPESTREPLPLLQSSIFSKLWSTLAVDPEMLHVSVSGPISYQSFRWSNGRLRSEGSWTQGLTASFTDTIQLPPVDRMRFVLTAPQSAKVNTSISANVVPVLTKHIRVSVEKFLSSFGGKVSTTRAVDGVLIVHISNAQKMIVPAERLWEDVDINLILQPSTTIASLICIVDGRWKSGGLSRPPSSLDDFHDMEPKYSKQVEQFAGSLLTHIVDGLTAHETPAKKGKKENPQ